MKHKFSIETHTLYVVATPIGNLADITQRAIDVLSQVDLIAAEDTRHSKRLLQHLGLSTPLIAFHAHNENESADYLISQLHNGKSIALISDAGTPLISDPGYPLIRKAKQANIAVVPLPGACALITALSVSGLSASKFVFEGFIATTQQARQKHLAELRLETRTIIFYEAPHRILDLIDDMITVFGPDRYVVLARELTKTFETIHGDYLSQLKSWLVNDTNQQKGEFVVLVQGMDRENDEQEQKHTLRILEILLRELPLKQAVKLTAEITGDKKNALYDRAVEMQNHKV